MAERTIRLEGDLDGALDGDHLGDLGDLTLVDRNELSVELVPATAPHPDADPLDLPALPELEAARSVTVVNHPRRQPVDLDGLARWTMLRRVTIQGSVTGLDALLDLPGLRSLELRLVDDLDDLPPLDEFALDHLAALEVDVTAGNRLRLECRDLGMPKAAPDSYRGWQIADLRSGSWFDRRYRLPFAPWPAESAQAAKRAFSAAEREIVGADQALASEVLDRFGAAVSRLDPAPGPSGADDVRLAYDLLLEAAGLDLPELVVDDLFRQTCRL
ncbi:MAG: hypothetical protein ACRBI6_13720 [Acidimicrobiales bacterium]